MMQRNKVTHIYELVKAYGSTMQIRFNRQDKGSRRAARKTSACNRRQEDTDFGTYVAQ